MKLKNEHLLREGSYAVVMEKKARKHKTKHGEQFGKRFKIKPDDDNTPVAPADKTKSNVIHKRAMDTYYERLEAKEANQDSWWD